MNSKKVLSILLTVAMLLSLFSVSAFATASYTATLDENGLLTAAVTNEVTPYLTEQEALIGLGQAKIGDNYYDTLQHAFDAAAPGDTVKLFKSIDITGNVIKTAPGNSWWFNANITKSITFDGANYSVTVGSRGIYVNQGGSSDIDVTIKNVAIYNHAYAGRGISTRGKIGTFTLSSVAIGCSGGGNTQCFTVGGSQSTAATINVNNTTMTSGNAGYCVTTFNPVDMTVSNSGLYGWASFNIKGRDGSEGSHGSVFNITGSTMASENVNAGDSNAFALIKIEDDDVTVNLGEGNLITVAGTENLQSIVAAESLGNADHGTTGEIENCEVNISGGSITMSGTAPFSIINSDDDVTLNITGGNFTLPDNDSFANWNGIIAISGGTFNKEIPEEFCAEGYIPTYDSVAGKYTVKPEAFVAQIGSIKYESLEEAIEAAQSGDTIELIADIDYSTTYSVRNARDDGNGHDIDLGDLTLDLNGHTIYSINGTVTYGGNGATITNGTFDLVEKNTDGSYKDGSYALFIDNEVNSYGTTGTVLVKDVVCDGGVNICSADVTLDNVSAHTTSLKFYTVWAETGATVNVNGGTYTDTVTGGKGVFHTDSTATINVNAGTFEVGNKVKYGNNDGSVVVYGGIFTKDPTAYVADGYEAVDNNDGTWTVKSIYAAQIGNVKYATLAEAVAAVPTNGTQTTITLLKDVALENGVTVSANKNIVLELNGKTLSGNTDSTSTYALITNRGILTIQDNTDTNKNGTGSGLITTYITNPDGGDIPGYASNTITNTGTLTVKSGMIVNNGAGYACYAIDNQTNGANYTPVLNIEGGRMQQMNAYTYAVRMFCNSTTNFNTVNVSGGIIEGGYGLWLQSPNEKANRAELNISGGVIDARDGFALFIGGTKADRSKNRISITDGTIGGSGVGVQGTLSGTYGTLAISGGQFAGVQAGSGAANFITGGIFGQDPSAYVANGYEAVALTGDDLGKWKVGEVKAGEPTKVETTETFDATYQVTKQVVDDNNDVIGEGTGTLRTVNIRVVTETVDEETTIASVNDADKIIQSLDMEKVLDTVVATVEDDDDDIEVNVQIVRNKPDFDTDNNTITYEVHPEAIVSVNGLASAPVVVSNDSLEEDAVFTITLPVPDALAEGNQYIKVTHISEGYQDDVQIYPLQQDEFGKYFVRFDVTHFSEFELAANDLPLFAGRSITLNGYINLNFYLNLAPDQVTNGEGTVVHFTWAKGTDSYKVKTTDYVSGQGYKASVRLPAAELNYPIRATVEINGVPQEELDDYSVRDYANIILNANSAFSVGYIAENGQAKYDKLVDLVKKMLDYGAKAKVAFGLIDDVPLANSGVDYTMPSTSREELLSLIDAAILAANGENTVSNMEDVANEIGAYRYYSSSLIYLSGCTLRHYFVAQGLDASKFTGVKSGYYYYVDMPDIAAANLDVLQEFHIGETTFRYSALDFVKAIIWNYAEGSSYDLAAATYWYNQAANAYFE